MISKAKIVNRVRQIVSDKNAVSFSSGDMDIMFDGVIDIYNQYRPLDTTAQFTSQAGVDLYAAATTPPVLDILEVTKWATPNQGTILRDFFNPVPPPFINPANFYQYDEALAEAYAVTMTNVGSLWKPTMALEYSPTQSIYMIRVNPVPIVDGAVMGYRYSYAHSADTSGNFPTIPDNHTQILVQLLSAELLDAMANDLAKLGRVKTADSEVETKDAANALRRQAASYRQDAYARLDTPTVLRGETR